MRFGVSRLAVARREMPNFLPSRHTAPVVFRGTRDAKDWSKPRRRCQIPGCDAVVALEAAHISPYMGELTNHVQNGLLLRADLHSLFDLGLISVDPASMRVVLSEKLQKTQYGKLAGCRIELPENPQYGPNPDALKQHLTWANLNTDGNGDNGKS
jgi:hypothetical protein